MKPSTSSAIEHMDIDEYDPSTSISAPELGQTIVKIDSFQEFLKFFRQKYVYRCLHLT